MEILSAVPIVLLLAFSAWCCSLVLEDVSIVDIIWPLFPLLVYAQVTPNVLEHSSMASFFTILLTCWSLRLCLYLLLRNYRAKREDTRYVHIRYKFGKGFWYKSLLSIFALQAVLALVMSAPFYGLFEPESAWKLPVSAILGSTAALVLSWFFLTTATVGFIWESIADRQLSVFMKTKKPGEIMRSGLWSLHRHPNYFGEWVFWMGLSGFAITAGLWWSIFSIALMSWLLMRFSGVERLEYYLKQKEGFQEYTQEIPAFFPRFHTKS